MNLWEDEFGASYAVPRWFEEHADLTDSSWHNDVSPSFETGMAEKSYPQNARVRIWVEHPDPSQRESLSGSRYWLQFTGEGDDQNGISRYCDDIWIVETDDLSVVDCLLRWAQDLIAKHGLSMCPIREDDGSDPDLGIFPEGGRALFDSSGKPNFPDLPPLPSPCALPAPSEDVERALQAINRQRASVGLAPLDPQQAGWTDEDVLEEAKRIRLKNRLMAI